MLGQHSQIAAGLETYWFDVNWQAELGRNGEPLNNYIKRLSIFFGIDFELATSFSIKANSAPEFISLILGEFAAQQKKARWLEKTPGNILHVPQIFEFWPDAKVIHIVRDPRDVYASLRQIRKWDTVTTFGNLWCKFLWAGAKAAPSAYEIRYENIILEPEKTMRAVLEFLEEPWESNVAQFSGKADDFDKVKKLSGVSSSTLKRLKQPLTSTRIGIWQEVIDDLEISALRKIAHKNGLGPLYEQIISETPTIPV